MGDRERPIERNRSCDSHELFDDLEIAQDPSYEKHLNKYPEKLQGYTGDILLVGISYDRDTKQHDCQIEQFAKV